MKQPFFSTPKRLASLCLGLSLSALCLSAVSACRGCDIAGVFYFCSDEGPHELVQNPPAEWRARAADVQRELYAYTKLHSPEDTLGFIWRDSSRIVFVRVLGHGIPGAAARSDGDTVLFNAGNESNTGIMRHEFVHWVQPGQDWLTHDGQGRPNIHIPAIFDYVHAPLVGG